jgi:NifU-like protein involved in Fe-S cluster formation
MDSQQRQHTSEIAQIRERIALEYESANRVFTDFTPTARHEYITRRQENIAACFRDLTQYMSPHEAMQTVLDVEQEVYGCIVLQDTISASMQAIHGGSV